jgi:hypothetical protein
MQGAATQAMRDIVEERQRRRCPSAAAPHRAGGSQAAIFYASRHTIDKPENRQQNVKLFLRSPYVLIAEV